MKILLNTASVFKGGSVQGAYSIIKNLIYFPEHQYYVILSKNLADLINRNEFPSNFIFYFPNIRPGSSLVSLIKANYFFSKIESHIRPDIVFTTSGPAYWRPSSPHLVGFNLAHYVYFDTPFFSLISFSEMLRWKIKGFIIKQFFKFESQYFVAQTEDITNRIKNILKLKNVYTVSNSCNELFYKSINWETTFLPKERNEFRFLSIAAYYRHKNLEIIPIVSQRLIELGYDNIRFVLTIQDSEYQNIIPVELRSYIYNVGPLKITDCPGIYQECDAAFLPTLLECFSASYLEAMAMERPILTTDLGFSKTICTSAALYFEPTNIEDIVSKIIKLSEDKNLREQLINNGLKRIQDFPNSFERTYQYLKILESIVSEKAIT